MSTHSHTQSSDISPTQQSPAVEGRFDAWQQLTLSLIKRVLISALLIAVGVFILLSLMSYSINDPSWSRVSTDSQGVVNLMGASGAWFADVFLAFLGYAAWIVPLFFLYELVVLWWVKQPAPRALRYSAVLFSALALAASLAFVFADSHALTYHQAQTLGSIDLPEGAGGILGYELAQSLLLIIGKWLGMLFTVLLFLLAFSYGFQVKWLALWRSRKHWFAARVISPKSPAPAPSMTLDKTMQASATAASRMRADRLSTAHQPAHAEGNVPFLSENQQRQHPPSQHLPQNPLQSLSQSPSLQPSLSSEKRTLNDDASLQVLTAQVPATETTQLPQDNHDRLQRKAPTLGDVDDLLSEPVYSQMAQPQSAVTADTERAVGDERADVPTWSSSSNATAFETSPDVIGMDDGFHTDVNATEPSSQSDSHQHAWRTPSQAASMQDTVDAPVTIQPKGTVEESAGLEHTSSESTHNKSLWNDSAWHDSDKLRDAGQRASSNAQVEDEQILDTMAPMSSEPAALPVGLETSESLTVASSPSEDTPTTQLTAAGKQRLHTTNETQDELVNMADSQSRFTPETIAVTEGNVPDDMLDPFAVLDAQLQNMAVSSPALSSNESALQADRQDDAPKPMTMREKIAAAKNERIAKADTLPANAASVTAPVKKEDFFAEQTGSRAFATAAHRATLSPLPSIELLEKPDPNQKPSYSREELARLSELLEIKLNEFNVKASVVEAQPGPVVTRFQVDLAAGVKVSKVTGIARDLARSLSMASVRVVEVIPGKPYIGIEVPNTKREMVRLYELLTTQDYQNPKAGLSMAMGKDIAGRPVVTDLAKAPHMLVAGTTGSGKSVAVNAMLLSLLLKYTPEQLRLILIDPKQLELANYNDIPHLLTEVVTDMKDAASALNWCVMEMERRYKLMAFLKVRKLSDYNKKIQEAEKVGEDFLDPLWRPNDSVSVDKPPRLKPLPAIVVVADEFADMIMQVGKQAEELITRLAQKSRAAGIHLILATQRPSVDVITGLIKANIPTRVALRVNSKVDSRTILDTGGAEDMLGNGDMLFLGPGKIEAERAHGAYISDDEVNTICDAWRERGSPDYVEGMLDTFESDISADSGGAAIKTGETDAFYDDAVAFVMETRKVSASSIQRKFSIGYNRAARIVDAMEAAGLVSSMGKSGKREILM